jgi:hypothetical protein
MDEQQKADFRARLEEHAPGFDWADDKDTFAGWVRFMEFMSTSLGREMPSRETLKRIWDTRAPAPAHDCYANAVPYESDGPLGHGWECGICGEFLQAG